MNKDMKTIVVTGSTGFLGRALKSELSLAGFSVRELPRTLNGKYDPGLVRASLKGASAVIHCAWETPFAVRGANVKMAVELIQAAQAENVPFVFISSLAAHDGAASVYGMEKYEVENYLNKSGADFTIVKPGTIIGAGGVFGAVIDQVKRFPALPLFFSKRAGIQTVWIGDLCAAIRSIVASPGHNRKTYAIATDSPTPMREFYEKIAAALHLRRWIVRLPGDLAIAALRIVEYFGAALPITSENLLGMKHLRRFPSNDSLEACRAKVRSFDESLAELITTGVLSRERAYWTANRHDTVLTSPWISPAGEIRKQRRIDFLNGIETPAGARVLELGAGSGVFTEEIARRWKDVTAIDLSEELLSIAGARIAGVKFMAMDAHSLKFPDNTFDVVVGVSILHHLDWERALREAYRVLKPGGQARFVEPNLLNPQIFLQKNIPILKKWAGDTADEYAFTPGQARKALLQAGFGELEIRPFEFLHPATPGSWIETVIRLEKLLMKTPLRAFGGSILMSARKTGEK